MIAIFGGMFRKGPVLTDGAWGTELQKRGLPLGYIADFWNLENPGPVLEVARAYVEAGSRVILTNTFRANEIALSTHCSKADVEGINRAGVLLSRNAAAGGRAKVFASIGPTGRLLDEGSVKAGEVRAAFQRQTAACAQAGANALLLETFSDPEEARIALEAAHETELPVILSFAYDSGRNKDRTMMGLTPEQSVQLAMEGKAAGIGANCGVGIDQAVGLCQRLRAAAPDLPIWIKPNAGIPVLENGEVHYRTDPVTFASFVPALIDAGATFIGGCCGSTPDFIRAIAAKCPQCGSC